MSDLTWEEVLAELEQLEPKEKSGNGTPIYRLTETEMKTIAHLKNLNYNRHETYAWMTDRGMLRKHDGSLLHHTTAFKKYKQQGGT